MIELGIRVIIHIDLLGLQLLNPRILSVCLVKGKDHLYPLTLIAPFEVDIQSLFEDFVRILYMFLESLHSALSFPVGSEASDKLEALDFNVNDKSEDNEIEEKKLKDDEKNVK